MNLFRIILIALCTAAGGISVAQAGGDAQAGQQLIASCAACHGKDGNRDGNVPAYSHSFDNMSDLQRHIIEGALHLD